MSAMLVYIAGFALVLAAGAGVYHRYANQRPTHCYEITHGPIRMWPYFGIPVTSERVARDQMARETCGTLGDVTLWQYELVYDEAAGVVRQNIETRKALQTIACDKKEQ